MKKILFTLALIGLAGCAYKSKIADLETKVAQLEADKHDACAIILEISNGGRYVYLGENTFVDILTGQEQQIDTMVSECDDFLEMFRSMLDQRKDIIAAPVAPAEPVE